MPENIKTFWSDIKHYRQIKNALDQDLPHGFYTYKLHSYDNRLYTSMERNGELVALYDTSGNKIIWSVQDGQ